MKLDARERAELFELWKRGAPFPEIAAAVDSFIQDAATRASGASEEGGGADGGGYVKRYCDA